MRLATQPTTCNVAWCMPSRWTFQMPPVQEFLERHLAGCSVIVDPFCGTSTIATHRNDIASSGVDARDYCWLLMESLEGRADAVLFDPPYSPRQIKECYERSGRKVSKADTQSAALYRRTREPLRRLLKPGGVGLSFGWQSSGFGKRWPTVEILLVRHGGGHNDTICVAQRKPDSKQQGELFQ